MSKPIQLEPATSQSVTPKERWTLKELLSTEFEEQQWIVEGVLTEGLSILAGRPKVGKSWLALDLAYSVSTGKPFLGIPVQQRKVLYLALEDSPLRLKGRLTKTSFTDLGELVFHVRFPTLDTDEGIAALRQEIEQEGYEVVIIDTFSRAIVHADQRVEDEMTAVMGAMQSVSRDYNISVLIIDHQRKGDGRGSRGGGDPFDEILGSTAKTAVADTILVLLRDRNNASGKLLVTGRDIEEREISLSFDIESFRWNVIDTAAEEAKAVTNRDKILETARSLADQGVEVCATSIAAELRLDRANVSRDLNDLARDGKLSKLPKIGSMQPYAVVAIQTA